MKKNTSPEAAAASRISAVSIGVNIILSVGKLAAGLLGKSGAMVSDAVHSASDVFSTIIVIIGVNIAGKKADAEHPYGHERMESIAALALSAVLEVTGLAIGWSGLKSIFGGDYSKLAVPTLLPMIAAVISIGVKEWMFRYTRAGAKKVKSDALMADAWHHRSDALSSVGSLIGIGGARLGFPVLDSVASVVICVFIVKAAYDIFSEAIGKLVDRSCDRGLVEQMREVIVSQPDVVRLDEIKTRLFGSKIYVDIEIAADGSITLFEAHKIAEGVHDAIEGTFPDVKHCMVHVNPCEMHENDNFIRTELK